MPVRIRSVRVEAVVLRHNDWGEADRFLTLYTREIGKARVIAKGVRKIRSRKAGHLEPLTRVNLLLARGRDILIVTQAETVDAYLSLRDDLLRVSYASFAVELIDRFTFEEDENRQIYLLLTDTLARLNTGFDPQLILQYYELHLLDLLGYRPHLFHCAHCQTEIKPEDQYFSAAQGGVLCPTCGSNDKEARPISMQSLKYLRHFQRSTFTEAARAKPIPEVNQQMEQLLLYYWTYLLERNLNSPAFIRLVKGG